MRITSKGPVTIPAALRKRAGLLPHTEMDIELECNVARIVHAKTGNAVGRSARLVVHLRGRGDMAITTSAPS